MLLKQTTFFVCLWALFILSLAMPVSADHDWGKITDEEWAATAPPGYPEANAIILFDVGKYEISRDIIDIYRHMRIKILTEAGIDEAGELSIVYHDELDKIKKFSAQVITPEGKKIKVEKDAIFEKESGKIKTRTFAFPQLSPGSFVECKYNIQSDKRWSSIRPWYFQNFLYTLSSEIELKLHPGFRYDIEYFNVPFNEQQSEMEEHPDPFAPRGADWTIKTFRWNRQNLLPVKDEPYMSCENDYRSALRFQLLDYKDQYNVVQFFHTWQETGKDFQKYLDDYCNCRGDIEKLALEITAGKENPREKSRAIFEYIVNNFETSEDYDSRYFVHDKLSDLLKNKFGSGEGKNILFVQMHKAVDIPAWPVLISTRDNSKFNPNRPGLGQFNYLIAFVQVGDDWEFIDTSGKHCPYGILSPACLTDGGFLIDGDQSDLVRITIKPAHSIRTDTTRMYVDADGMVTCSTLCCFSGYTASRYGERYDGKTPDEFIDDYFTGRLDRECTLGNHECRKDSAENLLLTLDYSSEELAEKLDNNLILTPICYAWRDNPFKSDHRFVPVDFIYQFAYRNVVVVSSAAEAENYILPEDLLYQLDGALFERKCRVKDNKIFLETALEILKPQFATHEYRAVKEFFDKVSQSTLDEITLVLASESDM